MNPKNVRASYAPVAGATERIQADEGGLRDVRLEKRKSPLMGIFRSFRAMERTGIEPVTSGLQSRRSPS
jgi:hypothetical protein